MTENQTLSPVQLRPVRSSDMPEVVELEKQCFKDPYPESFLVELSEDCGETFVVALVADKLVGYAVVASDLDQHHLLSIAVEPGHRRIGIAKKMLAFLEAEVRSGTMILEVRKSNVAALEFYKQNRFAQTGIVDQYYLDGEDAITMQKRIDPR